jgi:hypothetical protein
VLSGDVYQTGQAFGLKRDHRLTQAGQVIVTAALVVDDRVGAFLQLLDPAVLEHALDQIVQRARQQPHGAMGSFVDLTQDGIPAAYGLDERTGADWQAKSGKHSQTVHEHLVEQPRDLGHVQADEIRAKLQGKVAWLAMATWSVPACG